MPEKGNQGKRYPRIEFDTLSEAQKSTWSFDEIVEANHDHQRINFNFTKP